MAQQLTEAEHRGDADEVARLAHREPGVHLGPHNLARVEHGAAQAENEALKVSAQETTAALQETTAELQDLKGELKWLQLHTKREHELARDPKRFRRELIVCAVVAVGSTVLTLVTMLVLGTIIREIAIETLETLRVWWAG